MHQARRQVWKLGGLTVGGTYSSLLGGLGGALEAPPVPEAGAFTHFPNNWTGSAKWNLTSFKIL